MKRTSKSFVSKLDGPLLDTMRVAAPDDQEAELYPFCLPIIRQLREIVFPSPVTFFVGENGTGKSTVLEAIAYKAGFGLEGGSKNMYFKTSEEKTYAGAVKLGEQMTLSWRAKPVNGYFFRAESFYNIANYIDVIAQSDMRIYDSYGGKSLHEQSHGESFLSFFKNRLSSGGFFICDEPEAALSPQRQLSLIAIMHQLCTKGHAQFIIATHSPILLAYPGATIYSFDGGYLKSVAYRDTEHYRITKDFLDNPELYLQHLFKSEDEEL